jgi:hypothetical protein
MRIGNYGKIKVALIRIDGGGILFEISENGPRNEEAECRYNGKNFLDYEHHK